MTQYKLNDIYNVGETGLYFRAIPNKSLTLQIEKVAKGRLTTMLCWSC